MERWKLSRYTKVIESDSKDVLLHNSFMGAIAQIPPQKSRKLKKYLKNGFKKTQLSDPDLKELCENGFFVPSEIDEHQRFANYWIMSVNMDYI